MLFFWNFLICVRYERNETIIFSFFLSHVAIIFSFFEYFCYFFVIFYYELGRNETERQYLFSFFLGLFQPILDITEAILVFFSFFNFFAFFFCIFFSAPGRNGTERNDKFYFLPFSSPFILFWLEMDPKWYCLIF